MCAVALHRLLYWTFTEKAAREGLSSAELAVGYYAGVGVGGPKGSIVESQGEPDRTSLLARLVLRQRCIDEVGL